MSIAREGEAFTLSVTIRAGTPATYLCHAVVAATGVDVPNIPSYIPGIELAEGYEDMPASGDSYEQQSVAVLGVGNSAFEIGNALATAVNYVHLFNGRMWRQEETERRLFTAWESRYHARPLLLPRHRGVYHSL